MPPKDSGTSENIHGIQGSPNGEVFACGTDGAILRYGPEPTPGTRHYAISHGVYTSSRRSHIPRIA